MKRMCRWPIGLIIPFLFVVFIGTGHAGTLAANKIIVQALAELHHNPTGQQILTLFKTGRVVPFQPRYLDSVQGLHNRLTSPPHPISSASIKTLRRP